MDEEIKSYSQPEESLAEREDTPRTREIGEASEPNAPYTAEENESMSTVLDSDPIFGVQSNDG